MIEKYLELINSAEAFYTGSGKYDEALNRKNNKKNGIIPVKAEDKKEPDAEKERLKEFDRIVKEVSECRLCGLSEKRKNAVPGTGPLDPLVMVIGEAPGAEEDEQGLPFVGKAGKYLDKWLEAIDLSRGKNVFIGNIIKCRPPANRDPLPEECKKCSSYLFRQINILKPRAILSVGRISSQFLLKAEAGIGKLRGKVYYFNNIPLVPTYHPAGVLRNPQYRKDVWEDLKLLREEL